MGNVEKSGVPGGEGCQEEETRPLGLTALALSTTCGQPWLLYLLSVVFDPSCPFLFREDGHGYRVERHFQGTADDL